VSVLVALDLLGLCVPVQAFSYPAEVRHLTAEVDDCPSFIVAVVVAVVFVAGVVVSVVVAITVTTALKAMAAGANFLNGRLRNGLVQMSPKCIEGERSELVFPMPFKDTGNHRSGF
jgi:hypothetical protein